MDTINILSAAVRMKFQHVSFATMYTAGACGDLVASSDVTIFSSTCLNFFNLTVTGAINVVGPMTAGNYISLQATKSGAPAIRASVLGTFLVTTGLVHLEGISDTDAAVQLSLGTTVTANTIEILGTSDTDQPLNFGTAVLTGTSLVSLTGIGVKGVVLDLVTIISNQLEVIGISNSQSVSGNLVGVEIQPSAIITVPTWNIYGQGGDDPLTEGNIGVLIANILNAVVVEISIEGIGGIGLSNSHGIHINGLTAALLTTCVLHGETATTATNNGGPNHGVLIDNSLVTILANHTISGTSIQTTDSAGVLIETDVTTVISLTIDGNCTNCNDNSAGIVVNFVVLPGLLNALQMDGICQTCGSLSVGAALLGADISPVPLLDAIDATGTCEKCQSGAVGFYLATGVSSTSVQGSNNVFRGYCDSCGDDSFGIYFDGFSVVITVTPLELEGICSSCGTQSFGISIDSLSIGLTPINTPIFNGSCVTCGDQSIGLFIQDTTIISIAGVEFDGLCSNCGIQSHGIQVANGILNSIIGVTQIQLNGNCDVCGIESNGIYLQRGNIINTIPSQLTGSTQSDSNANGILVDSAFTLVGGSIQLDGDATECENDCFGISITGNVTSIGNVQATGSCASKINQGDHCVGVDINSASFTGIALTALGFGASGATGERNHGIHFHFLVLFTIVDIDGTSGTGSFSCGVLFDSNTGASYTTGIISGRTVDDPSVTSSTNHGISLSGSFLNSISTTLNGYSNIANGAGVYISSADFTNSVITVGIITVNGDCELHSPCYGVYIDNSFTISYVTSTLVINANTNAPNGESIGVYLNDQSTLSQQSLGSISMDITSTSDQSNNIGFYNHNAIVVGTAIDITIVQTGSGSNNIGFLQDGNASEISTTLGALSIDSSVTMDGNSPLTVENNHGISLESGVINTNLGSISMIGVAGVGTSSHGIQCNLSSLVVTGLVNDLLMDGTCHTNSIESIGVFIQNGDNVIQNQFGEIRYRGESSSDQQGDIISQTIYSDESKISNTILFENRFVAPSCNFYTNNYNLQILEGGAISGNADLLNAGSIEIVGRSNFTVDGFLLINSASSTSISGEFILRNGFDVSSPVFLNDDVIIELESTGVFRNTMDSALFSALPSNLHVKGLTIPFGVTSTKSNTNFLTFEDSIGSISPITSINADSSLNTIEFIESNVFLPLVVTTDERQDYQVSNQMNLSGNIQFTGSFLFFDTTINGSGSMSVIGNSEFPEGFLHEFESTCTIRGNSIINSNFLNCDVTFNQLNTRLTGFGAAKSLFVNSATFAPSYCFTLQEFLELQSATYEIEIEDQRICTNYASSNITNSIGRINIFNSELDVFLSSRIPQINEFYHIVQYLPSDPSNVNGEFNNKPDNGEFLVDNVPFIISYDFNRQITLFRNTAPTAIDDSYDVFYLDSLDVSVANGLLRNDIDPDSGSIGSLEVIDISPLHPDLDWNADGSFFFQSTITHFLPLSFTYTISDGFGTATATLTINPVFLPSFSGTLTPTPTTTPSTTTTPSFASISATPSIFSSLSPTNVATLSSNVTPTSSVSVGSTSSTTITSSTSSSVSPISRSNSFSQTATPSITSGASPSSSPIASSSFTRSPISQSVTPTSTKTPTPTPSSTLTPGLTMLHPDATSSPSKTPSNPISNMVITLSPSASISFGANVVVDEDGRNVGTVTLPDGQEGDLDISVSIGADGLPIIDINFFDFFGNPITTFDEPVEICFNLEQEFNINNACLAFYNEETEQFECQDKCLTEGENGIW